MVMPASTSRPSSPRTRRSIPAPCCATFLEGPRHPSVRARRADRTDAQHVNQIVTGNIGISGDVALLLERALSIRRPGFWTRADADYQAWASKEKARATAGEYWAVGPAGSTPAALAPVRHHRQR